MTVFIIKEKKAVEYGNQHEIAKILDVPVADIPKLTKMGVLPPAHKKHGRDIDECERRYHAYDTGLYMANRIYWAELSKEEAMQECIDSYDGWLNE
ncbi:hypothetical protein ACXITX_12000 [Vibrio parahaemolyticus]